MKEHRRYNDNLEALSVLWDTANTVAKGKVLIQDKEGSSEVDIDWVLTSTHSVFTSLPNILPDLKGFFSESKAKGHRKTSYAAPMSDNASMIVNFEFEEGFKPVQRVFLDGLTLEQFAVVADLYAQFKRYNA